MSDKLTETVTVQQEVTGPIKDLVLFARYLENRTNGGTKLMSDDTVIKLARDFWDKEHGE